MLLLDMRFRLDFNTRCISEWNLAAGSTGILGVRLDFDSTEHLGIGTPMGCCRFHCVTNDSTKGFEKQLNRRDSDSR